MDGEQTDARLCYLFRRAILLHDSWRQQESYLDFKDQCIYVKDPKIPVDAYIEFLRTAFVLQKPSVFLAMGGFDAWISGFTSRDFIQGVQSIKRNVRMPCP